MPIGELVYWDIPTSTWLILLIQRVGYIYNSLNPKLMNRLQILRSTNQNYSTYDKILEEETGMGAVWLGDIHSL